MTFLSFLDYLKQLVQIAKILGGEACTIQAPKSDVKVHVPEGRYGCLFGNIFTNYPDLVHLIPNNECLLGPICAFVFSSFGGDKTFNKFWLQIPHKTQNLDKIRVRHVSLKTLNTTLLEPSYKMDSTSPYLSH